MLLTDWLPRVLCIFSGFFVFYRIQRLLHDFLQITADMKAKLRSFMQEVPNWWRLRTLFLFFTMMSWPKFIPQYWNNDSKTKIQLVCKLLKLLTCFVSPGNKMDKPPTKPEPTGWQALCYAAHWTLTSLTSRASLIFLIRESVPVPITGPTPGSPKEKHLAC